MCVKGRAVLFIILLAAATITQSFAAGFPEGTRYTLPWEPYVPLDPPVVAQQTAAPEFRAMWVDTWGNGMLSPTEVSTLVDTLAANNFNAVVAEVRKSGDAYYNSSYEPWATNIQALGYDPLKDLIEKAHAKGIEVHGWIVTYRIWAKGWRTPPPTHIWRRHPEWAMATYTGSILDGSYYDLDPGVPGVQQYLCDVVKDLVTKYDVDGVNFDYIRYPGYTWGYNPLTKQRFSEEFGFDPPTSRYDANWDTWCDFRRQQVTDLVRKCYAEVMAIKPHVKMSVDAVAWMEADPNTDWPLTRPYNEVFQDSRGWMEQHIIDMNIMMNYKREYNAAQANDYRLWTQFLVDTASATGRHGVAGPAIYLNSIDDSITQLGYARSMGADGLCMYSYRVTNKDNSPSSSFYAALTASLFQEPAPVTDMPWKSAPTTAMLFGQVTDKFEPNDPIYQNWVYKAAVTVRGPVVRKVITDATGTYFFTDLPPGQYQVIVWADGFVDQQVTTTLTVGPAKRLDFQLEHPMNVIGSMPIGEVEQYEDGTAVELPGKVVTVASGTFPSCIYVEEGDRSNGIRVMPDVSEAPFAVGDRVDLMGVLATINGERVLKYAKSQNRSAVQPLAPLAVNIAALSGKPSATGLLVQCTGKVANYSFGWLNIDDGSGTIKVMTPINLALGRDALVRVNGICRVETDRVLRARYANDIIVLSTESVSAPEGTILSGLNLIGLPNMPIDPSPSGIFGGLLSSSRLFRWDDTNHAFNEYNPAQPTQFGNVLRGSGYAVTATGAGTVSYQGASNSGAADVRTVLPKSGWNFIGHPFAAPTLWSSVSVTDGESTLGISEAARAGWIMPIAFGWDNAVSNLEYVILGPVRPRFDDSLRPWSGYWVQTSKDNLALIIPVGS